MELARPGKGEEVLSKCLRGEDPGPQECTVPGVAEDRGDPWVCVMGCWQGLGSHSGRAGAVCVCVLGGGAQGKHRALLGGYCSNSVVWDQSDRLEKVSSGRFWTR